MATPVPGASRILVVDDFPTNAALLANLLGQQGYEVSVAYDGIEALQRVAEDSPDLIFLDVEMPRMDGYEVCRRLKADPLTRLIPVVILTGQDPFDARLRAWDLGADEFISKPPQALELLARCRALLRAKRLTDELDNAQAVLFAFARAVEAKSPYTHGHAERVTEYALQLADHLAVAEEEREILRQGALLHDIGKISIPDAVLNKPGSLSPDEYDLIKQHTIQGVRIIEPLRTLREAVPLIRWHHERLDGKGYPDGLRAAEIPHLVRILSVADVYDALSSLRPYRSAIPHAACLSILRKNALEGGLDPELVEPFCAVVEPASAPSMPGPYTRLTSKSIETEIPPVVHAI